ncbi:hypothetical protein PAEPH01_2082, partial [Pancytospora epiphaga]
MRFARFLEENKHDSYANYYLDYSGLSQDIREIINANDNISPGMAFFEDYDANFKRVFEFIQFRYEELKTLLESIEVQIIEKKKSAAMNLDDLLHEMTQFAEFIRVNSEGFKRILKKFTKRTAISVPKEYKNKLKKKIHNLSGLNELIYGGSRLKLKSTKQCKNSESKTTFVRKTNKYWVHNENLTALKTRITEHLPIYVFNNNPKDGTPYSGWDYKTHDTCVSSVYFDNTGFELYNGRLRK